jgi:uncharacterized protein DUF4402
MSVVLRRMWLAGQLLAAVALAAPAGAQSSASGSLAITALIVSPLSLVVTHPLDFGRLLTSSTKTIAPSAPTSGRFMLVGQGGSAVSVTLSMPAALTPPSGLTLPVTGWTYVVSDSPSLSGTPVSFTSGTSAPIAVSFQTFAGTTDLYFGIGATIQAAALQPATPYTGTGQITAAYTDL